MAVNRVTYKIGDEDLILETGKIGKQANGCVYAQYAGTSVIATVCASSEVKEGLDFVPVTVEYNEKYLEDINPDIVVITGHDSSIKQNSKYFSDTVKVCRKYQRDYDKLIIIAGACQSEYEQLIKSGANFASSPKKINVHALDPAIIALSLSLTDKKEDIDLLELLSKTSCGKDGFGGVNTRGVMTTGYPR